MTPLLLFLLGCAAIYFGTVSAAFNALMRLSLRIHAERSDRDDALGRYLDDPRRMFIPARIFTLIIAVLAAALLARVTGVETGFPLLVLSVVGTVLVCEHLVPLLIVRKDPEHVLDVLLPSFDVIVGVLRPLTSALIRIGTVNKRDATGGDLPTPPQSAAAAPVATEVESSRAEGQARALLRSLADFRETMVREVMTPRPDIIGIGSEATFEQMLAVFREQQYSRVPVYKGTLDNVLGFVFVKDIIQLKASGFTSMAALVRPAYFVPETKRVPDLLQEFQRKRVQSAIVVDEYGGTAGLVTIEDLLEEIVGEIRDEYDVEVDRIIDEGDGKYVFSGNVHVEEMASRLKVAVEGQGFETVGGYLLAHLGRVPVVGERLELDGVDVEVLEAERRRITRVRMKRREAPAVAHGALEG
ncbi:MAG: hemolysin family protein [Vicinamibacterales bacterium]